MAHTHTHVLLHTNAQQWLKRKQVYCYCARFTNSCGNAKNQMSSPPSEAITLKRIVKRNQKKLREKLTATAVAAQHTMNNMNGKVK